MNLHRILIFCSAILSIPAVPGIADQPAELQPTLVKPGELLAADSFDAKELGKLWEIKKGAWQIENGTLVGKEKEEDRHNAVLNYNLANRNSMIRFSFKLDGAENFALSFNKSDGHLFRIVVAPQKLSVIKDRDKKDPNSRIELLGANVGKFEHGKWYTLLVEAHGDQVIAQTDNGLQIKAKHASLDTDKPNYRFVVAGETLLLKDLKIWKVAE